MTHFLKYVAARLFFGTFTATFAVYWSLAWLHEVVYAGRPVEDWRFALGIYGVTLTTVSVMMSLWGRWRVNCLLEDQLGRLQLEYHPKILVRAYQRLLSYLESCYFFNYTREKLSRGIAARFGDILLGMRIEDDEAVAIYEQILERDPEQGKFYDFLIQTYSRKGRLSERSFHCLRRRFHERPDDRLVGILAREYTLRRILNFESERVLLRAIKLYPRHQAKVLRFVVPRLMAYQRTDDNAAQFYLAAAESGYDQEVGPLLHQLEKRYQEKGRDDSLAFRLARVMHDHQVPAEGETTPALDLDREESETDDTFTLEGLDYGADSLERAPEADTDGIPRLTPASRLHALLQKFFASGSGTLSGGIRWLKYVLVLVVIAALIWLARPLVYRLTTALGWRAGREAGESQVAPQPAGSKDALSGQAGSAGRYSIQVGAFSDSARAEEMSQTLNKRGLTGFVVPGSAGSRRIYRVRVGRYDSQDRAESAARTLLNQGVIEEWQVVEEAPK